MRFLRLRRIHFVGAGGVGMSGLAEILLLSTPLEISGCDRERSENTDRLTKLGAKIAYGHDPKHVLETDLLVTSAAVADSTPEVEAARQRGIPVIRDLAAKAGSGAVASGREAIGRGRCPRPAGAVAPRPRRRPGL